MSIAAHLLPRAVLALVLALLASSPALAQSSETAPAEVVVMLNLDPETTRTIRVPEGARVRLELTTDAPSELHLHGYDLERMAGPQSPAVFTFVADYTGRFAIVAHGAHGLLGREKALAYLEVRPE